MISDSLIDHTRSNSRKKYGWLLSLLKIGFIGFGGGNALIPVIEQEVVGDSKLVSKEEYDEDVIVSSITPGALTVKISAAIGRRVMGAKGMLLAALLMAMPGFVTTVLMTSLLFKLDESIIRQIEFTSIGIIAFILSGLIQYIKGAVVERKESYKSGSAIMIIILVFFLSCEKNVYSILGISQTPIFSVSTINILIISFFVIFYTSCKFNMMNVTASILVSITYLLCVGAANIIDSIYIYRFVQIIMIVLSCVGIIKSIDRTRKSKKIPIKPLLCETGTLMSFQTIILLLAIMVFSGAFEYIGRGFLSVLMSFGGGDAYLAIADGMFVSNGMIPRKEFYGHLVLIANALPGSILCKILSGVGYYIGYGLSGDIIVGYAVAFAGFTCSVTASCGIFSLGNFIFRKFESIEALKILKGWIRTIISGLLVNVILAFVYQCMKVGFSYNGDQKWILLELVGLYVVNEYLSKVKKVSMGIRLLIVGAAAAIFGNIIM
ncbi:chromate transporter [Clostridium oryzae]|uniref:Putative chromate transport protein n=1 Tax=Clostridium oryzae TaxID=1450648 RepID=A0A1V4INM8_9CLOT|nr:chromate transporter [Clostridium oryzae]OPJ61434.1 putative chromate transport protein [Clostridium oryzae]